MREELSFSRSGFLVPSGLALRNSGAKMREIIRSVRDLARRAPFVQTCGLRYRLQRCPTYESPRLHHRTNESLVDSLVTVGLATTHLFRTAARHCAAVFQVATDRTTASVPQPARQVGNGK